MAWSLPSGRSLVILSVGVLACLFYGPLSVWTDAGILVMSGTEVLWSTVRPEPVAAHPLKTAIHNVTYDFDEVGHSVKPKFAHLRLVFPSQAAPDTPNLCSCSFVTSSWTFCTLLE